MATKVILGKSTNSNLGHSAGKYGVFVARAGEEDVTTCSKDELILNTDAVGNTSGAIGVGQMQIMPGLDASNNPSITGTISVSGSSTATVNYVNEGIGINWVLPTPSSSFISGTDGTSTSNANSSSYGGVSSLVLSNSGNSTFTSNVSIMKGFSIATDF